MLKNRTYNITILVLRDVRRSQGIPPLGMTRHTVCMILQLCLTEEVDVTINL